MGGNTGEYRFAVNINSRLFHKFKAPKGGKKNLYAFASDFTDSGASESYRLGCAYGMWMLFSDVADKTAKQPGTWTIRIMFAEIVRINKCNILSDLTDFFRVFFLFSRLF